MFLACAVVVIGLVGCRSGLKSLTGSTADVDPFLTSDDAFGGDHEEPISRGFDRAENVVASGLNSVTAEASEFAANAERAGNQFVSEFDNGFEAAREKIQQADAEIEEIIDGSLFEDLPATANKAVEDFGGISQTQFQKEVPMVPPDPIALPEPRMPTVNSGLGSASPWGRVSAGNSGLDVELSFEEDDVSDGSIGSGDFPIQLEEFDSGQSNLNPPRPETVEADAARSGSRWNRFNIFSKQSEAESQLGRTDAKPVEKKSDRKSIRDRFSKLGARFGLGDDDGDGSLGDVEMVPPPTTTSADCMADLIARTQAKVANVRYSQLGPVERETYLRNHVNLRLFYLANNQNERALDAIPGIPPAEQEFWQQMFWSLSQYRNSDAVPDRTERITQTVSQLRAALQRLQETAKLQLRNVSFCRRINGYGNYERFENDVFKPGDPVLVYAEIENFRSEPTTSGQYRTILRSVLQIVPEAGGESVDKVTLRPVEDVCRSPRRDYFNSYEFTIPNNISPGRYVLDISVEDRLSGKSTTQSVAFVVK
jgi:hypothetical protein